MAHDCPIGRRPFERIATLVAAILVAAGAAVEIGVRAQTASARGDLPRALARAEADAPGVQAAREQLRRGAPRAAAVTLAAAAEDAPEAGTLALARVSAAAAGDFDAAARYAAIAARLLPGDARAAKAASDALDAALLSRVRPVAWGALALGGLALAAFLGTRERRRNRHRRRSAYVDHLEGRLAVSGDAEGLRVDLFLKPRRGLAPVAPPSPGPTLTIVLSNPEVSRTVRLSARHDVRDDAVRLHLRPETLREIQAHAGPWRLQARLDGRLVAEERLRLGLPQVPNAA